MLNDDRRMMMEIVVWGVSVSWHKGSGCLWADKSMFTQTIIRFEEFITAKKYQNKHQDDDDDDDDSEDWTNHFFGWPFLSAILNRLLDASE